VWFHGVAVFQPFAGLLLWKHFAGSRLISSAARKEIWIAFGATILGGLFLAYLIAQTLTQIIEEYGPNESITDNCYIKAAFQTDNLQTCKNLSELSGNMTVEKETVNYSGQRTDFYLKHIFRSVEQVQRPLITVDEIRRIKPPTKASNDPDSKITAPGDMLIFINGVAPIYGVQSLYFLNDALLARTKLKPPTFKSAAQPHAQAAQPRQAALDIISIAATAIDQQVIEEKLNGNS
jgi:type IV secretion system protein VirD4